MAYICSCVRMPSFPKFQRYTCTHTFRFKVSAVYIDTCAPIHKSSDIHARMQAYLYVYIYPGSKSEAHQHDLS